MGTKPAAPHPPARHQGPGSAPHRRQPVTRPRPPHQLLTNHFVVLFSQRHPAASLWYSVDLSLPMACVKWMQEPVAGQPPSNWTPGKWVPKKKKNPFISSNLHIGWAPWLLPEAELFTVLLGHVALNHCRTRTTPFTWSLQPTTLPVHKCLRNPYNVLLFFSLSLSLSLSIIAHPSCSSNSSYWHQSPAHQLSSPGKMIMSMKVDLGER